MLSDDLKQNCRDSLMKIVECLKDFLQTIEISAVHLSIISRESTNLQFAQSFDHGKIRILQEMPDAKSLLLKKLKDNIRVEFTDLELIMKNLKVLKKNIVMEYVNIADCIKKAHLSSEELHCPAFGCDGGDSFADIIEDVYHLEKLIENEYLCRKYEVYGARGDFFKINDDAVSRWKETGKLLALQKDLEKYIAT